MKLIFRMSNSKRSLVAISLLKAFKLKKLRAEIEWHRKLHKCIEYATNHPTENKILVSREVNSAGSGIMLNNKTCYEVIRKDVPVKFFMDIDCQYDTVISEFRSLLNTDSVVKSLKWYVSEALHGMGIESANELVNDVIVLDASSEKKFSIHLVFQNVVFPSIEHCSAVLRWIIDKLYEQEYPMFEDDGVTITGFKKAMYINARFPLMVPLKHGDDLHFLFDRGVYNYNCNQNFRMWKSKKFEAGKPPLDVALPFTFENFKKTLITFHNAPIVSACELEKHVPMHCAAFSCQPKTVLAKWKLKLGCDGNNITGAILKYFKQRINGDVTNIWYDESPHGTGVGINISNGDMYLLDLDECAYSLKRKGHEGLMEKRFIN
ncbi:hypothetical protein O9G_001815 [Rozella allomycis CSF55]|uniref:Uncharacterized protein n=1 Tax=Rozella allomycis (strain CSF55) TaxID=988480 RepID=A0A075B0R0_ROZAC|nr:hypothetical protein O9G_001815 [Rozella allomycis CSF55]|eukprot:EPZ34559.1 hypothetical protein O9G_001815 [Rozella allomycis CSF55]